MAMRSSEAVASTAEIVGYVECCLQEEIVGWAWKQGSDTRLRVELRAGSDTIGSTTADGHREDLQQNGVGDGRHSFRLMIPVEFRNSGVTLHTVATDADGTEVILSQPPIAASQASEVVSLKRNIDLLIGSQRVIHRNLQAALLKQGPSLSDGLAEIVAGQERISRAISTLELFQVRIEDLLQTRLQPERKLETPRAIKVCAVLSSLACLGAGFALWRVLIVG